MDTIGISRSKKIFFEKHVFVFLFFVYKTQIKTFFVKNKKMFSNRVPKVNIHNNPEDKKLVDILVIKKYLNQLDNIFGIQNNIDQNAATTNNIVAEVPMIDKQIEEQVQKPM